MNRRLLVASFASLLFLIAIPAYPADPLITGELTGLKGTHIHSLEAEDHLTARFRDTVPAQGALNFVLLIGCAAIGYFMLRKANGS